MQLARAVLLFSLRHTPLALSVILIALWIGSLFWIVGWTWVGPRRFFCVVGVSGNLRLVTCDNAGNYGQRDGFFWEPEQAEHRVYLGRFELELPAWTGRSPTYSQNLDVRVVMIPIPFLLTFLLPLAIGPFIHYRFPLWTWFVWVGVIAGEMTWYGRIE